MKEEEFDSKLINSLIKLRNKIEEDKMIYGDAFIHLTDRKMEVIEPSRVIIKYDKKGKLESYEIKEVLGGTPKND